MPDTKLITDLAEIGTTAWASKELAGKLLGPTFEYLGGEVKNFTAKCNINLTEVFRRARRKLGPKLEEPGGVSPRVLRHVLNEGAFCEDRVASEYIAGILASSRAEEQGDDRGVPYLAVIRELSTHQLRMHYLIYWSIKQLLNGQNLSVALGNEAMKMRIFLPGSFLDTNFSQEADDVVDLHAFTGLARQDLIDPSWWGGPAEVFAEEEPLITESGYLVTPTKFGVELFLWAHGHSNIHVADFLAEGVLIDELPDFQVLGVAEHAPDNRLERERQRVNHENFVRQTIASRLRNR
jgi:hypothetical protein